MAGCLHYTGQTNSKGDPHGWGRMTWEPDGGIYEGLFNDGKRHGHGRFIYFNGAMQRGGFEDGLPAGQAQTILANELVSRLDNYYLGSRVANINHTVDSLHQLLVTKYRHQSLRVKQFIEDKFKDMDRRKIRSEKLAKIKAKILDVIDKEQGLLNNTEKVFEIYGYVMKVQASVDKLWHAMEDEIEEFQAQYRVERCEKLNAMFDDDPKYTNLSFIQLYWFNGTWSYFQFSYKRLKIPYVAELMEANKQNIW